MVMTLSTLLLISGDKGLRILLVCIPVILLGCDLHSSTYRDMSDKELRKRNYQCQIAGDLAPAEIQVCKNIRRECDRRAAKGSYVC